MKPTRFSVSPGADGMPLQDFLADAMGLSRRRVKALIDGRAVFVNERRVWMARHALGAGDTVELQQAAAHAEVGAPAARPEVLFRDRWYAVVNKPPAILSCGPGSLETVLRRELGAPRLCAVHRLDRDTSGCLIFAFDTGAFDAIVPLFRDRRVEKQYLVLVERGMKGRGRTINSPLRGEESVTHVEVLDSNDAASCLDVRIETGRTHQIRRHLVSIGHPVLGDREYAAGRRVPPEYRNVPRQMLHAFSVGFPHPFTGGCVTVTAPVPADFRRCLASFNLRLPR